MQLSGIEPKQLSSNVIMSAIEEELIPIGSIVRNCFARVETKTSATAYFNGLISLVERKNSWQLAEQAGCKTSYGLQYLLGRATCGIKYPVISDI